MDLLVCPSSVHLACSHATARKQRGLCRLLLLRQHRHMGWASRERINLSCIIKKSVGSFGSG